MPLFSFLFNWLQTSGKKSPANEKLVADFNERIKHSERALRDHVQAQIRYHEIKYAHALRTKRRGKK